MVNKIHHLTFKPVTGLKGEPQWCLEVYDGTYGNLSNTVCGQFHELFAYCVKLQAESEVKTDGQ